MVNINKANNNLWPQIKKIKTTNTCGVGNTGPSLGQERQCVGVKPVNGTPNYHNNVYYIIIQFVVTR